MPTRRPTVVKSLSMTWLDSDTPSKTNPGLAGWFTAAFCSVGQSEGENSLDGTERGGDPSVEDIMTRVVRIRFFQSDPDPRLAGHLGGE